jgi:hypothetical protein
MAGIGPCYDYLRGNLSGQQSFHFFCTYFHEAVMRSAPWFWQE